MFSRSAQLKAENDELRKALQKAQQSLDAVQMMMADRTALVSLATEGSKLRIGFVRRGEVTYLETYNAMYADIPALRKALLERLPIA